MLAVVLAACSGAQRRDDGQVPRPPPAPVPGRTAVAEAPAPAPAPTAPDPDRPATPPAAALVPAPAAAEPAAAGTVRDACETWVAERRGAWRPATTPKPLACADAVRIATEAARRHGLDPGLVLGIMRVESGFVTNAISPATAVGLMQVMPATGKQKGCGDLFDPLENADCGARVIDAFLRYYKGDLILGLSGYNAGHGMPDRARRESRVPKNFQYFEDVLRARARWLRHGCKEWD